MTNIQFTQTVSNGMINLRVTWNQPTSDRLVQHYDIWYRIQGISSWTSVTPNPTTRQTTIRNVDKGSVYKVRVRAVSDNGSGWWRSATSQRTYRGSYNIIQILVLYKYKLLLLLLLAIKCIYIYVHKCNVKEIIILKMKTYRGN